MPATTWPPSTTGFRPTIGLREEPFELLLTDIVMPEMDGIELARRATELDPDIKVMFITGFAAVALNPDNNAPRDAKILSKPFHLKDLVGEVQRLLGCLIGGLSIAPDRSCRADGRHHHISCDDFFVGVGTWTTLHTSHGGTWVSRAAILLVALVLLAPLGTSAADARVGGGFSFGSRGTRTFSMPPPTSTAPRPAFPMQRTETPSFGSPEPSFAPRPRFGFGSGLAAGLLGAGLFGLADREWLFRRHRRDRVAVRISDPDRLDRVRRPLGPGRLSRPRRDRFCGARPGSSGRLRRARRRASAALAGRARAVAAARRHRAGRISPLRAAPVGYPICLWPGGRYRRCRGWRRPRCSAFWPPTSRPTETAACATNCPMCACCRATSPRHGARARLITRPSPCGSRRATSWWTARAAASWKAIPPGPFEATELWTFRRESGGPWQLVGDPADELIAHAIG